MRLLHRRRERHSRVAQDTYPEREQSRIIVPFTPGTGIDILARTLGQKMGDDFKQAVVVDNRPGASGNIGTEAVAKAAPDGYTLLMTANTIVLNRSLFKSIPYDPIKDFVPVAPLAIGRLALVTHPSIGAKTVADFVALAKREPGKLNYGSPGNGTPHHLAMELFKSKTGIDIVHVPYKGTAGAVSDLLERADRRDVPARARGAALRGKRQARHARRRRHRSERARRPTCRRLPRPPAFATSTPTSGTRSMRPPERRPTSCASLDTEINALLKSRDVADTLAKQGLQPTGGTADDLAQLTRTDLERWSVVVRDAKIQPD